MLPATSNGKAAELAAQDAVGAVAAIAPRLASEVYGLNIVAENIQDLAAKPLDSARAEGERLLQELDRDDS